MAGPIGSSQFMYNSSGASSFYDYQIEQSARFDDAGGGTNASSRLSRTFGTASSATKFTFSVWVKRSTTPQMTKIQLGKILYLEELEFKVVELHLVLNVVVELQVD